MPLVEILNANHILLDTFDKSICWKLTLCVKVHFNKLIDKKKKESDGKVKKKPLNYKIVHEFS